MTNMESIKRPASSLKKQAGLSRKNNRQTQPMTILTTNRFLMKALRTLCCVGALTACPAWATVVTWQLNATGNVGAAKDLPQSGYTTKAWGVDNTPVTNASHQFLFRTAPESGAASESGTGLAGTLNNRLQADDTDIQQESHSALFRSSAGSSQPDESLLFAASNTPIRAATELDEAMAKTFDEEFVSIPTVQFASTAPGSQAASVASMASMTSGPGPVPVPEMSALFPIVGLITAVSCTQILRRRRAAQQSAARSRA
jgi:hypothetical protein